MNHTEGRFLRTIVMWIALAIMILSLIIDPETLWRGSNHHDDNDDQKIIIDDDNVQETSRCPMGYGQTGERITRIEGGEEVVIVAETNKERVQLPPGHPKIP
jgi:hypothetical protein